MKAITVDILPDASEVVHYNFPGIPLYSQRANLSEYQDMRAICHWHQDFEFMQILSGRMNYFVNGIRVPLKEGDCLFVNSCQMHYGYDIQREESSFICTLIHPSMLASVPDLEKHYVDPLCQDRSFPYHIWSADDEHYSEINTLLTEIYHLGATRSSGYDLYAAARAVQLFPYLMNTHHEHQPILPDTTENALLREQQLMVAYIAAHYSEELTLQDIAGAASVSKSTCCRLFDRFVGQTPFEFLNAYRLEVSCHFLADTDENVTDIARKCGYNHPSYFGLQFRRRYGCSPMQYRRGVRYH